jgi:hypothetical protein
MALAYLTAGSQTLAAAAWSDAAGFADNATLIVDEGTQTITTSLNAGSGLATGISYIHFRKGFTGQVGSAGTSLETKFANYTTLPNVILTSGSMWLTCTNTCNKILVQGGTLTILSGTVSALEIVSGTVNVSASATVTALEMTGGIYRDLATSSNVMGTATVYGGTATFLRTVTTANISEASGSGVGAPTTFATFNHATGPTTVNLRGGRWNHLQGGVATLNAYAGVFDASRAWRDLTIGGTATNLYPFADFRPTSSGATVTVSNTSYKLGGPVAPLIGIP